MRSETRVVKKVVVFFGLIASGKSFVAKAWAEKHRFAYYNTDVIRKQLAGIKLGESCSQGIAQGIYSPAMTRRTYDALLDCAEKNLDDPAISCVVLDGSYQSLAERKRVCVRFAGQAQVVFVMCRCKEEITKARLAQRALDPAAVSDGSWQMYLHQKEVFEYPEELSDWQCRRLDTNKELNLLLVQLDQILQHKNDGDGEI
ncbi:MAG: AAA family ATPase [Pseudomonadota bacterium]